MSGCPKSHSFPRYKCPYTVPARVHYATPKKYFVFAFPHQRHALEIFYFTLTAGLRPSGVCVASAAAAAAAAAAGRARGMVRCWGGAAGRGSGGGARDPLTTHCLD